MGLFGLGKKKTEEKAVSRIDSQISKMQTAPVLPEFPSLEEEESVSDFPKYEPTVADIKNEISRGTEEEVVIPVRNQDFSSKRMAAVEEAMPLQDDSIQAKRISMGGEKPLFIRIDSYKEAMHTLDALKAKLDDAEEVLRAFEDIKSQEDEKLDDWRRDLQSIKEKLFSIDKSLFEV